MFDFADSLLPRIVDLALSASNRSTKVCASELLHALCLLMMGNCAKGPRTRTGESVRVVFRVFCVHFILSRLSCIFQC